MKNNTKTLGSKGSSNTMILDIPEDRTPLLKQPEVIRILILPYVSDDVLHMGRYVYMADKKPKWNIGR